MEYPTLSIKNILFGILNRFCFLCDIMSSTKDLTGLIFGRLTVIRLVGKTKSGYLLWECLCSCGNTKNIRSLNLIYGGNKSTKSCGCIAIEKNRDREYKHGLCKSPEYYIWQGMKRRCGRKKDISYKNYGAKGIKVCDRWLNSFANFLEDMGTRPSKNHSLDRVKSYMDYTPSNCRWATREVQNNNTSRNRKFKYKGVLKTMSQWAKLFGVTPAMVRWRVEHLNSFEDVYTYFMANKKTA